MRKLKLTPLIISLMLLLATFGLAVLSINVSVQEIGVGSCDVVSPVREATVNISWSPRTVGRIIPEDRYYYSNAQIVIVFSDDIPAGTIIYLNITLENWTRQGFWWSKTDPGYYIYSTTLTSDLPGGQPLYVSLPNSVEYLSYPYGTPLNVVGIKMVVLPPSDNFLSYTGCLSPSISLNVLKVGVGSDKYSPVSSGNVSITITERSGQDLTDYVVNFTLNGDWSSLYPYVTYENGSRLYYWYFYDNTSQKTWFWVKMNLSASQTTKIYIFYGNQSAYNSTYNNPNKVFWFFDDFNTALDNWTVVFGATPVLVGGILNLTDGTLIITTEDFGTNVGSCPYCDGYEVALRADLGVPVVNGQEVYGPLYLIYVDTANNVGLGEIISSRTYRWWGNWQTDYYDYMLTFDLSSGSYYVYESASNEYILNEWAIFQLSADQNGTVYTYQNGSPVWILDFSSENPVIGPFGLGQDDGSFSLYDWVAVYPYVYPRPLVRIEGQENYVHTIYFKP